MPHVLFLTIVFTLGALAYHYLMKPVALITDILETLGNSSKGFDEIQTAVQADERSLARALKFTEEVLKLIQRDPNDKEQYTLTRTGICEVRRMHH